jgi:Ca2+-binding RTX toxin-like protein
MRRMGLVLVMMTVALVVGSGVAVAAVKFGTGRSDFLRGTNSADQLFGKGGGDFLAGKKQDDVLYGGDGYDLIHGGAVGWGMAPDGRDRLFGGNGPDCMFGGSQGDVLMGGLGNDEMGFYCYEFIFDAGVDTFYGGSGNDFVWSWDYSAGGKPQRDLVFCGGGRDEVLADKLDRPHDCERVQRIGRT